MSQKVLAARRRNKEKKAFLKISLVLLGFFVFSVLVLVILFSLDSLKIKTISVLGNESLPTGALEKKIGQFLNDKTFGLSLKNRIFYFPRKAIAAGLLADFPRVKSVEIENDFPSRIEVRIEERSPVALVCRKENKQCLYLDEGGFIFDGAPYFSSGVFLKFFSENDDIFQPGEFLCDGDIFKQIFFLQKRIQDFLPVEEIILTRDNLAKFYTAEGFHFILNIYGDFDEVYKNFSIFFEEFLKTKKLKDIEYVDLRFGNKIYYK